MNGKIKGLKEEETGVEVVKEVGKIRELFT